VPFVAPSAKQAHSLNATAQPAAVLNKGVATHVRVDFLKFHGLFADHAGHEIQKRALIVVHAPVGLIAVIIGLPLPGRLHRPAGWEPRSCAMVPVSVFYRVAGRNQLSKKAL
jgi:hypothetical protein